MIAASQAAFTSIKLAGALYLVYLGIQTLRATRSAEPDTSRLQYAPLGYATAFRQGLVSNLLNPKIAVFFTSLLPQFVDARHAVPQVLLLLGGIFNCIGVVWLVSYAAIAARGRDLLTQPQVRRAVDLVSGITLVGLGLRLAAEHRR